MNIHIVNKSLNTTLTFGDLMYMEDHMYGHNRKYVKYKTKDVIQLDQ